MTPMIHASDEHQSGSLYKINLILVSPTKSLLEFIPMNGINKKRVSIYGITFYVVTGEY